MYKRPHIFSYSAFVFVFFFFLSGIPSDAALKGDLAPEFTLKSLDGKDVNLSDYRGKYVLVNFWATWCGPCKIEMPSIEELYQRFRLEKFDVLAISNDMFGERVVRPYIESQGFTFTVLLDPMLQASKPFGVVSLPTTYLIDPKGKIIGVLGGAENWYTPRNITFFENLLKPEPGS